MIITVTLNPSLDRTVEVRALRPGQVHRTSSPTTEPGGKGVNVTRALSSNGVASVAVLPVGGPHGAELIRLLDEGLAATSAAAHYVPVTGRTRSNLTVADIDGVVTKFNEPGAYLEAEDLRAIVATVRDTARAGDWVVVSGSLPTGVTTDAFVELLRELTRLELHLVVDTSGDALSGCLAAGPRIIKPNRTELAELVGRELVSIADVLDAAREVRERGADRVLVSLGGDGAVLVTPHGAIVGQSPISRVRSSVGAGDSFLAGFLSRFSVDESDEGAALVEALAWGSAATTLPGSAVPAPSDLDFSNVRLVWRPDLDRPLVAS